MMSWNLAILAILASLLPYALGSPQLLDFPEYRSLAGLALEEIQTLMQFFDDMPGAQPLPPPIKDTSSKLVNDAAHPFKPLRPGDIRGPCPGLNTLASHGYLSRRGVVTPAEIITAVQEGFNLGHQFASFLAYSAFINNGNHLTNLMSIGANTTTNGHPTTGINTHGTFEGDASLARDDFALGNNFEFNETLFDAFIVAAEAVGKGVIDLNAAVLNRQIRINDSIARNPSFTFGQPRFLGGITETGFFLAMFVNGQKADNSLPLTLDGARHFFDFHRFPHNFHRRHGPYEFPLLEKFTFQIIEMIGQLPGNNNGVNNYIVDLNDPVTFCNFYQKQVNTTARLYPNPHPRLKKEIKKNLITFYQALGDPTCEQYFPFG